LQLYVEPNTGCFRAAHRKDTETFSGRGLYLRDKGLDVFFVTLNKSDKDYSPSTMYRDYAINEEQFHWQSQSIASIESAIGQRYINQQRNGNRVLIFVRDYKKEGQAAVPYTCIG